MQEQYRTVLEGGVGELEEKKSRFIATVEHVESEEEAAQVIQACRKKYWDASHHCSAYIIGSKQEIQHCSDDGEPGGTAGRPMLDVLLGGGFCNVVVVATRYFGGTLLGTGGLVRAYSGAAKAGLAASTVIEKKLGRKLLVETDYNSIGKVQYILAVEKVSVLETLYTDRVQTILIIEPARLPSLQKKLTEATAGGAVYEEQELYYFAQLPGDAHAAGKEIRLFEQPAEQEKAAKQAAQNSV